MINMHCIRLAIEEYYGVTLMQQTRKREVADKKKIFVYLARKYTTATYQQIAEYLGYHNHTTVLAAHRGCEDLKIYSSFTNDIAGIEKLIAVDDNDFYRCVGELRHR